MVNRPSPDRAATTRLRRLRTFPPLWLNGKVRPLADIGLVYDIETLTRTRRGQGVPNAT
jgi:hypothetical protein